MEWEPEQLELGGLGFTGICRETFRVLLRAILPHTKGGLGAAIFSVALVAHFVVMQALFFSGGSLHLGIDDLPILIRLVVFVLIEMVFGCILLHISLICTACYVFRVASLYCTDGDSDATDRILRDLPRAPLKRLYSTFMHVVPLAILLLWTCLLVTVLACLTINTTGEAVLLPLWVLLGACLAGSAYVTVVSHIACVVAVLEDAVLFGALCKSRALLAGKFWAVAAVFVPLDGCFAALIVSLLLLTLNGSLGIAVGVAMAVALWAVVLVTLVAQPVVYMVCKNHHHEVVDKVHLNYVGEYQRIDVDGDSGMELQPVETTPQPTATSSQPSPRSAVLPST